MSTRSLTVFHEDELHGSGEIAVMYRQSDGYPEGHGKDLRDFLRPYHMVNGMSIGEQRVTANGAGCLAAQVVAHFKNGAGGIYLHKAGTRDCDEEWIYHIYPSVTHDNIKIVTENTRSWQIGQLDKFGKVWYNRPDKEKGKMTGQTGALRYSESRGEWLPVADMHPRHVVNALLKDLRTTNPTADEVVSDPVYHDMFDRLANADPDELGL